MTGYEEFQKIMSEMKFKIQMRDNQKNKKFSDLPLEFEELFNQFKK